MFTESQASKKRDALASKLAKSRHPHGVHVHRREIEQVGAEKGSSLEESARLFEELKGEVWRGDCVESHQRVWGAWITEVR